MFDIIHFDFFQNAILGAVLSAIVCGIIGSYIVSRRIVFLSGGITHASFGGIGIALFLGMNPILGALLSAVLSVIIVSIIKGVNNRDDAAIAAIWALGMSVGVIFTTLTPGYNSGITSYLFGNILLVNMFDISLLLVYTLCLVIAFGCFYKHIVYSAFDENFARTRRYNPQATNRFMLILVAIGLVLSIRLVGIMLLMSLLTLPQMTMVRFTNNFKSITVGSIIISLSASIIGLFTTALFDKLPSSAVIIVILFVVYTISLIASYKYRQFSK